MKGVSSGVHFRAREEPGRPGDEVGVAFGAFAIVACVLESFAKS